MDTRRMGQGGYTRLETNDTFVSQLAEQDKVPWYSKPNLRFLYLLMCPTCFGVEITNGFDGSMTNGLQSVPSWLEYYHHPRSALLGLMVSMHSLGGIAALPFVPSVADGVGRRYSILFGGIVSIIGGILQGSAFNLTMFIIARFILGFANVFCIVAASSLVGELSHPKERAVIGCLFNSFFDLGAIVAAGVTLQTFSMPNDWGWRIPSFFQVLPSLLQVSFIWFLPESPRWLVSKGRGDEAYSILAKYHAEGDENSDFVKSEYAQIEQTLETELKIAQRSSTTVLSTPGMRKRIAVASFLGLFVQWCGHGLISSFLSLTLDSIGIHDNRMKNVINFARYCWSFITSFVSALIAPRYPRRRIYLVSTVSIFAVLIAWTIASREYSFTGNKVAARAVLVLIGLFDPVYNLAFTALTYTFLVELFPFHARARGIAVFQWWSRGGGFLNKFANPIGMEIAGWKWNIVYCVWDAFQVAFVYAIFPETSGRTLEELAFLYEGDPGALREGDSVETLRERGEAGMYGAIGD